MASFRLRKRFICVMCLFHVILGKRLPCFIYTLETWTFRSPLLDFTVQLYSSHPHPNHWYWSHQECYRFHLVSDLHAQSYTTIPSNYLIYNRIECIWLLLFSFLSPLPVEECWLGFHIFPNVKEFSCLKGCLFLQMSTACCKDWHSRVLFILRNIHHLIQFAYF